MDSTFLSVLIIRCEAPKEVAAWYSDKLGLSLKQRDHDFSCMLGHVHFAIHGLLEGQSATRNAELGIYVPNVDRFVKTLQSKNVELADPVRDYPWARAAQIKDPLGNLIYLMQLPESSLEGLGTLLKKEFAF
jgi:predicted enzyme related to lactoylglutathione lyase